MKKTLTKKLKKSSNAIRYFSGENLTKSIAVVDTTCYMVDHFVSCTC